MTGESVHARRSLVAAIGLALACGTGLLAQPAGDVPVTRELTLAGRGPAEAVPWQFRCHTDVPQDPARPRCSESWSTIQVPSNWELQGFGTYNYGHDERKARDVGAYRRTFEIPSSWSGRRIDLVFDGVMTDTEVRIDGEVIGPVHRGGFYRFAYDVTERVQPGREHTLDVLVHEHSSDRSVNAAERDADYWVFGGIYRRVWLRALPALAVDHVAVDARHDGSLTSRVRLRGSGAGGSVRLRQRIVDVDGNGSIDVDGHVDGHVVAMIETALPRDTRDDAGPIRTVTVGGKVDGIQPWNADVPRLYRLEVDLLDADGAILHRVAERIGFRTVELRWDDSWAPDATSTARGLYVNGRRVRLRGVNRHAFWPSTGRAVDPALDRADVERMKSMNLNAVRTSHYPPNEAFLDACDELGLYVIDELAGWHDAYSTAAGRPLVRAMVERDVNHPSIILWANGNEDGWNPALDDDFAQHDPQGRQVLHPRSLFRGVDTQHYDTHAELTERLRERSADDGMDLGAWWRRVTGTFDARDRRPLVLPTEILHGLYDGGSGAGLAEYWRLVRSSDAGLGLFLWVFTDEAVLRTDRPAGDRELDRLDTDGNHAPDGILGPHRETSAQELAVRQIFAPVQLTWFLDTLRVYNQTDDLDLVDGTLHWRLEDAHDRPLNLDRATDPHGPWQTLPLPSTPPGELASLRFAPLFDAAGPARTLRVQMLDAQGREIGRRGWPLRRAGDEVRAHALAPSAGRLERTERDGVLRLLSHDADGSRGLELDTSDLSLRALLGPHGAVGPSALTVHGRSSLPAPVARRNLDDVHSLGIELAFAEGAVQRLRWQVFPSGWIRLSWGLHTAGDDEVVGMILPFDEANLRHVEWTGEGPVRQWRNRTAGRWGRHQRPWTGDPGPRWSHEPKLRGYYAARRATLHTTAGPLTLAFEDDRLYLGLFAPRFPDDAEHATVPVHQPDGLALLHRIGAIGTKFHPASDLAPSGPLDQRLSTSTLFAGAVWIYPGEDPLMAQAVENESVDGPELAGEAQP